MLFCQGKETPMPYHKYRNTPTTIDGHKFDSAAESRRYTELKFLQSVGKIKDLELQPPFLLQDKYVNGKGKKIQAIFYIADFRYWDFDTDAWVIEDVKRKATATAVYKIKRKLFEKIFHPSMVVEVDA
jgi:hypothetical protein